MIENREKAGEGWENKMQVRPQPKERGGEGCVEHPGLLCGLRKFQQNPSRDFKPKLSVRRVPSLPGMRLS